MKHDSSCTDSIPLDTWQKLVTRARFANVRDFMPPSYDEPRITERVDLTAFGLCLCTRSSERVEERMAPRVRGTFDATCDPACERVLAKCGLTKADVERLSGIDVGLRDLRNAELKAEVERKAAANRRGHEKRKAEIKKQKAENTGTESRALIKAVTNAVVDVLREAGIEIV